MVVKLETKNWYKSVVKKVTFDSVFKPENLSTLIRENIFFHPGKNSVFNVLEKFNSLTSSQNDSVDIISILKTLLIQDLGYKFIAICLENKEYDHFEVTYVETNKVIKPCNIYKQDLNNSIIECYNTKDPCFIRDDYQKKLGFKPHKKTKEVVCLPVILQDSSCAILCIGKPFKNKREDVILNLIAQQTGLILSNNNLKDQLKQNLALDPLTSLITHSHFQQRLNFEVNRAKRHHSPLSLMMIGVNNIEYINEYHSHFLGDEIISYVAETLKDNIRDIDIAARFSGDKMAVILPDTAINCAKIIAERFEKEVTKTNYLDIGNITVSIGIASYPEDSIDKAELLLNVDKALSSAKKEGKKLDKSILITINELNNVNKVYNQHPFMILEENKSPYRSELADELINNLYMFERMHYNSTILLEIITSLAAAIDAKDSYTRGHSQAVSLYAEYICNALGMDSEETEKIKLGALMHDIGKIGVPENVLGKPAKLNDNEWKIIKQHPVIGARRIIQPISALNDLIPVVEHHHENWNGTGYPHGLKEEEIPIGARIVSIADAFHTMTTDRPYRRSLGYDRAIERLSQGAGTQWDQSLINVFLKISRKAFEENEKSSSS
jgi:diguanylate cyclase (GGDEF)-like protein/putative nucleotidyltransferase with HDIG domain